MAAFLKRGLAMVLANSRLVLSGELLIARQNLNPIDPADLADLGMEAVLEKMKKQCHGLQIKQANGLCDITIRLFANGCRVDAKDFYDGLQAVLQAFAECVYAKDGLTLRMNVMGKLKNVGTIEEFRFLNKETRVSYKITGNTKKFALCSGLRTKAIQRLRPDPVRHEED